MSAELFVAVVVVSLDGRVLDRAVHALDLSHNASFHSNERITPSNRGIKQAEDEASDAPDMHFSADPDARWVRKGSKSTLGYKAFARADEEGFIDKGRATPATRAESPEFGCMIEGASTRRALADKAYAGKANRERLRGKHRDGIMRKAARNRPLRASEKRFNKLISKRRFRVEQCFGTMKRLFGLYRARYFGQNLLRAASKITFNPQIPAIA